jgi:phosphatidylserine/phosphatidylglycerophosphate/cardiolipin synthase-like enzyme
VDIKIVFDARKPVPGDANKEMVNKCGLTDFCTLRTEGASFISHNKFIVKLENGNPIAVWTGGMNFSEGGIFGHSNVAHVIEEPVIATKYMEYWTDLNANPKSAPLKTSVEALTSLPVMPLPLDSTCVFSPRKTLDAMDLYSKIALSAESGFFMTFAFGINQIFKDVYRNSKAPLRFALLEKATRSMKAGPDKTKELKDIQNLRNMTENIFAIGNFIQTSKFDGWVKEHLSGLNENVKYVHNKFMLVDPLSSDPIVITGSANFSNASTIDNDENMVIIRGNTRVADIYLGEFMRLFSHFSFRESLAWRKPNDPPKPLRTDNWWSDNFGNTSRASRRIFFSQNI